MNENTIIQSIPAANGLRSVKGFSPLRYLRKTVSEKTGQEVWRLDLRYQKLWFRLACPNGRMLLKQLDLPLPEPGFGHIYLTHDIDAISQYRHLRGALGGFKRRIPPFYLVFKRSDIRRFSYCCLYLSGTEFFFW